MIGGSVAVGDVEPIPLSAGWKKGAIQVIAARALRQYGSARDNCDRAATKNSLQLLRDCMHVAQTIEEGGTDSLPGCIEIEGEVPFVTVPGAERQSVIDRLLAEMDALLDPEGA